MLIYLLQKPSDNGLKVEYNIWKELLESDANKYGKRQIHIDTDLKRFRRDLRSAEAKLGSIEDKVMIPLGDIKFTESVLKEYYNISRMEPIEVPKALRKTEFLNREYKIIRGKNIQSGYKFIKDVSELKSYTYLGSTQYLEIEPDKLYQVSEVLDIKSEYRVYIIGGKVYNIVNYDGDCRIFPNISLIEKANLIYSNQADYPKSYTMDICIDSKGRTSIIEIHNLFSCGLYSTVFGSDFLYGYKESLDYVINHNTKLTADKLEESEESKEEV